MLIIDTLSTHSTCIPSDNIMDPINEAFKTTVNDGLKEFDSTTKEMRRAKAALLQAQCNISVSHRRIIAALHSLLDVRICMELKCDDDMLMGAGDEEVPSSTSAPNQNTGQKPGPMNDWMQMKKIKCHKTTRTTTWLRISDNSFIDFTFSLFSVLMAPAGSFVYIYYRFHYHSHNEYNDNHKYKLHCRCPSYIAISSLRNLIIALPPD